MEDMDAEESVRSTTSQNTFVQKLAVFIRQCGVHFTLHSPQTSKGRAFTSFTGSDTAKLLCQLPDKLNELLHLETLSDVLLLWQTLRNLVEAFSSGDISKDLEAEAKRFLDTFIHTALTKGKCYGRERVTPYIHILCHHAVQKHKQLRGLAKFSTQALEKKNDILKRLYHMITKKWDSAADALRLCKRREEDCEACRKRKYTKTDHDYWTEGGIIESRKRRERTSVAPIAVSVRCLDMQKMTPGELRTELASVGIRATSQDP
ncbi:hypothetical protein MTO96_014121 [Rhipicephalus appendiculatus]